MSKRPPAAFESRQTPRRGGLPARHSTSPGHNPASDGRPIPTLRQPGTRHRFLMSIESEAPPPPDDSGRPRPHPGQKSVAGPGRAHRAPVDQPSRTGNPACMDRAASGLQRVSGASGAMETSGGCDRCGTQAVRAAAHRAPGVPVTSTRPAVFQRPHSQRRARFLCPHRLRRDSAASEIPG